MNQKPSYNCGCGPQRAVVTVDEVFYRQQVYYQEGGGGCCQPRRARSDVNLSVTSVPNYSCAPKSPKVVSQAPTMVLPNYSMNRSGMRTPHNTPYNSPHKSPLMGPLNSTSKSSMMLTVPNVGNRSRSTGSLEDHTALGMSTISGSNKTRSNISLGRPEDIRILSGNRSVSRPFRN